VDAAAESGQGREAASVMKAGIEALITTREILSSI
jgi:hypothetical protein